MNIEQSEAVDKSATVVSFKRDGNDGDKMSPRRRGDPVPAEGTKENEGEILGKGNHESFDLKMDQMKVLNDERGEGGFFLTGVNVANKEITDIEMPKAFEVASDIEKVTDEELSPEAVDAYRLLAVVDSARTFSSNDVSCHPLSPNIQIPLVHLPGPEEKSHLAPVCQPVDAAPV